MTSRYDLRRATSHLVMFIHTWTLARFEDELSNRMRTRTEVKSRASTDPMSLISNDGRAQVSIRPTSSRH